MLNKILKILSINIVLFSFLFSQNNFSWIGTRNLYNTSNIATEYIGNSSNCSILGKNESTKISSSIFYQNYSWTLWSFSQRGISIQYNKNGLGISANMIGRGSWKDMVATTETGDYQKKYKLIFQERFINITYAKKFYDKLYIGILGKYLNTQNPERLNFLKDNFGTSIDIGFLYKVFNELELGLDIENILSTKIDYVIFDDFGAWAFANELPINFNINFIYSINSKIKFDFGIDNLFEDKVYDSNHNAYYIYKKKYHIGCNWNIYRNLFINADYYRQRRPTEFTYKADVGKFDYNLYNYFNFEIYYKIKKYSVNASAKQDNRKEKMERSPIKLKSNTFFYSMSLSYEL